MSYAECHYAECRYAECRYSECRYSECRYSECRYAECHYAECHCADCHYPEYQMLSVIILSVIMLSVIMVSAEAPPYLTQPPFTNLIKLPSRDYYKAPLEPVGSTAIVLFAKQFANVNTSLYLFLQFCWCGDKSPTDISPTPTFQFTDTIHRLESWKGAKLVEGERD
jgi:hypothetical protein